MSSPKW